MGGGGGESEVQSHPQLHSKFKAGLGYRRPCLKQNTIKPKQTKAEKNRKCLLLVGQFHRADGGVGDTGKGQFLDLLYRTGTKDSDIPVLSVSSAIPSTERGDPLKP